MIEIEPHFPQRTTRKGIELVALRTRWELQRNER
jgi:hypothetical protein